jgi:uncharacterized membrane protein YkoI
VNCARVLMTPMCARVERAKDHPVPRRDEGEVKHMQRALPLIISSIVFGTPSFASDNPKLVSEARIKETEARATALTRVKNGTVKSEELEREHGHLIYSYDIEVPGNSGIDEVNVDAMTGEVIAKTHEGPKAERKEADAEAKAKTKAKP